VKKGFFFLAASIFIPQILSGTVFHYDNSIGRKIRIKNVIRQEIYINGDLKKRVEAMNKALLEAVQSSNSFTLYKGKFYYYEKDLSSDDSYKLVSVYDSSFFQDTRGLMIVPSDILMPDTRNIPTFPTNDLKPGDSWKAPGEEVHQGIYDSNEIITSSFDVDYVYLGDEIAAGTNFSKFSIDYVISDNPKNEPDILSITGYSHLLYYWNSSTSSPGFYSDRFSILYTLRSGETILFKSTSEGQGELTEDATAEQKKQIVSDMKNSIPTNSAMSVREVADGIILNLGNILFDFNKFTLRKGFEDKLSKVAEVLQKYPSIDITVSGYTDNVGEEEYNKTLSENRAKTVAEFLTHSGISPSRISYSGYGSDNPVSAGNSEEGRSLNRRVEIKLITKEEP
jgi:outer membrane protein OmpA-like peptidoglycan-associated protein